MTRYYAPKVRLQPCPEFRIPLEGDLLTCWTCGHWSEDHDSDTAAE